MGFLDNINESLSTDHAPVFLGKPLNKLTFCVDFDGTIVEDKFPYIGTPIPGAIDAIKKLQRAGVKIILWTCRYGDKLNDAVNYLKRNGIVPYNVNKNGDLHTSNKVIADAYIDDRGVPNFNSLGWDKFISLIETVYNVKFE